MYEPIHPSGLKLSRISAGLWRLGEWEKTVEELTGWVEKCIDLGVTTFDHADIYGNYECESLFGKVLAEKPHLRESMELVSKCGICLVSEKKPSHRITHYNLSADHIITSVDQSLKNLNTDYLDLLLIHRPSPFMDADETATGLNNVLQNGKVKNVGVSNFTVSQFKLLQSRLDTPLVTNQVEFSLLHTNPLYDGTFDYLQHVMTRPMIWSPFGGGTLFTGSDNQAIRVRRLLNKLAEKYESTPAAVTLAWILKHPSKPFPVLGTGKIERIKNALKAYKLNMDRQDWFALLEASEGEPVP